MKRTLLTITAGLALCLSASATIVAQWDFNVSGSLTPAIGTGLASTTGSTLNPAFLTGAGSSDPLGSDPGNLCWKLAAFPGTSISNKLCGAQYALDTTGYQNITMTWDQLNSGTASRYWRIQYSTDNGATWVDKDVIVNTYNGNWTNSIATISFVSIPGANNSPNFMVRLVSEFQDSATGSGFHGYIGVNATYASGGTLKMDMVTFSGTTYSADVSIITDPASQAVGIGQPASFSVAAIGGSTPYTYQWRKNTSPIGTSTNFFAIAAAQPTDAGSYDVIVANGVNSQTSAVATLTVSNPQGIAWTGLNGATWDTATTNWVNTNSLANVAYNGGDYVLFDSRGVSAPSVSLAESLSPSSVTVDADTDYVLRSDVGGKIEGATGLTKRGAGTLTLDTDNTYSGPTVIQAGVVQVGAMDAHGSTGSGPITNNGALVFNRTDSITLTNSITGSGSLTNIGGDVTSTTVGGTLTLSGANTFNGPIAVRKGKLILTGNQTVNSTAIVVTPSAATGPGGATQFGISGGMVLGSGTTVYLSATADSRSSLASTSGTNSVNGPVVLDGSGPAALQTENAGTLLIANGNISGPSFTGPLYLRGGNGSGVLNGTINLPGHTVYKADNCTWTINSTNNSWNYSQITDGRVRLGAHNALPTGLTLQMAAAGRTATLDLSGFNQQLANLSDLVAPPGTAIVTNTSATADSVLTVGSGYFSGGIGNSATGGKLSLTLNGTLFTLAGFNAYSGNTTVAAGTLALSGLGDISTSPVIDLAGGSMDVSGIGTLFLSGTQTLKGNGTLSITGNLVQYGTIELKVSKAGVVSNDKVAVTGALTCAGTLKLVLTGQALNWTDTLQVFDAAGGYSGSIPVIDPLVPAPGATWDTSTLLTDGKLRIYGPPTFTSTIVSGGSIAFSGLGGEAFGTFSLLTSTNVAAATADWTTLQTGSFDASGNFSVTAPITPGQPRQFYKLQMP